MSQKAQSTVTIINRLGLHARPAMTFVDAAQGFACSVKVTKEELTVDGKSIMQMMMLAATQGTVLEIQATGADAKQAIKALSELFDRQFDEQ